MVTHSAAALASVPDPTDLVEGELARSRTTRRRILDAGIETLVEEGYKGLSTITVARRAGITRAAMLYHFPSRRDLVVAIVRHLTRLRATAFEEACREVPHDKALAVRMLDAVIAELGSPAFTAYGELAVAARTDPEIAAAMQPAMAAYDDARVLTGQRLLPERIVNADDFPLARDVVRFLSEGIALQYGALVGMRDPGERLASLRHFVQLLLTTPEGFALLERTAAEAKTLPPFIPPEATRRVG
jgi:AcrR family transcriptional regulator